MISDMKTLLTFYNSFTSVAYIKEDYSIEINCEKPLRVEEI